MDPLELKELLNTEFGKMNRLFQEGDILEANAILDQLVFKLCEEMK